MERFLTNEETVKLSELAGYLHEIAQNAVEKELNKILFDEYGFDTAYWSFSIKLTLNALSVDEFKVLESVTIDRTPRL